MAYGKNRAAALVLAVSLMLSSCGSRTGDNSVAETTAAPATTSAAAETTATTVSTAAPAETETTSVKEETPPAEPAQWDITIEAGNLPSERPDIKDDLYTYFNYDFIAQNQEWEVSAHDDYINIIKDTVESVINDKSVTGHDIDQLRLFYRQASDLDRLKKIGMSELKPYLDMIDGADTIKEFNKVLVSDDFPFSPFLCAELEIIDTKSETVTGILPNTLIFDPIFADGTYYNDHDDPAVKDMFDLNVDYEALGLVPDFKQIGMSSAEAYDTVTALAEFETLYAKDLASQEDLRKIDFDEYADLIGDASVSEKELCAFAHDMPIKGMLKKLKKNGFDKYILDNGADWLITLNELWTDEHLGELKLMAKAKLFDETRPYRDPTEYNKMLELFDYPEKDSETFAYEACNSIRLLCNQMADIYVEKGLGKNSAARLTKLTQDIVDAYKKLIAETTWLEKESKDRMTEKLDNIEMNILRPCGGYIDISGLELTPDEEGGTLFGNYMKLKQYRLDKERELIGKPAIRECLWYSFPPTLDNAIYDPISNSINILPGGVTPFEYTEDMDECRLLSGIGMVIGHELSHAFDYYTGARFDAYGQPNPVFDGDDLNDYLDRTNKLADRYSKIVVGGKNIDGMAVIGEAAADLSGIQTVIAIAEERGDIDFGEFFENLAHQWAAVIPEGYAEAYSVDEHPLNNLRINVSLQMFDIVYDEFGISEGDGMYLPPEQRVILWGHDAA